MGRRLRGEATALDGLVLGAVPYLNVAPLVAGLDGVVGLRPSDLAQALDRGEVDLATLPVGALVGRSDLAALPSTGIGCDGAVRTVLLEPSAELDTSDGFRPDPASRTSNLLARLVLSRRRGRPMEPSAESPLRVVIGDPAFQVAPERSLDLGQAWKEWTGLPFVFALWVAGPRLAADPDRLRLVDAVLRERARTNLEDVDSLCRDQNVVSPEAAREYLTRNIRHLLDARFRAGAERFASELQAEGLASGGIRWGC